MIELSFFKKVLVVAGTTEESKKIIQQPIHRMFLKSTLGASIKGETYVWSSQEELEIIHNIKGIIGHFDRYGVLIQIDKQCSAYLDKQTDREKAFDDLLKRGKASKRNITAQDRDQISLFISGAYQRELKDYQKDGVRHLLTIKNGANYSVPGSGKTSVALAYYHILRSRANVDGIFVIGPASCFQPWEDEYYNCFGSKPRSVRIAGISRASRDELYLLADQYEMMMTTYQSASRDVESIIGALKRKRYLLVLDEAHYIKRPQGGKTAEAITSLSKYAEYRVILTGTPMPNGIEDLWSQFNFLWGDQSPLGSVESYLGEIKAKDNDAMIASVKKKIDPLFFRTTKCQLNLPRAHFNLIKCDLSPLQSRIYGGVAIRFLSQLNEEPKAKDTLREWRRARAIRLLQIASNPTLLRQTSDEFMLPPMKLEYSSLNQAIEHYGRYETPCKFLAVKKLVTRLCDSDKKVIVWSSFVHNLMMLEKLLSDYNPVVVYGGVPFSSSDEEEVTREQLIAKFKSDNECKLLIANPAACAESISLHMVCHQSIYLDRTFNCAHYMQSLDRIHRIGLDANQKTEYFLVVARNTIDEVIHNRLKQKMLNMENILEDALPGRIPGYWADQFSDEEDVDMDMVEAHIRKFTEGHASKT